MADSSPSLKNAKPAISPRELVFKYIRYIPWLLLSVAVALTVAYIKLHYSVPVYNVAGKLLVTSQGSGSASEKFNDIFMMQGGAVTINDEIEIIKSRTIAGRVIQDLGLLNTIVNKGKIRNSIVHPLEAPFLIDVTEPKDSLFGFSFLITIDEQGYVINEETVKHAYGEIIPAGNVKLRLLKSNTDLRVFSSNQFLISRSSLENGAAVLSAAITVAPVNEFTNVLGIGYNTENIRIGREIVNQYMYEYQQNSLDDKRQIAANALNFITQQLDTVKLDLSEVEGDLQRYREVNRIVNPQEQASLYFGQLTKNDELLAEQTVKLRVLDILLQILSDKNDPYKIVPSMLGTEEPVLLQQITEYNRLQLDRETALKTTPSGNPLIRDLETRIEKLRIDMIVNLNNVKKTYDLNVRDTRSKIAEADKLISSMPAKEKKLLDVQRQQNILQELYSFLLQKKLETAIGSASTISNIKVVDSAILGGQVSPNPTSLYVLALMIGIAIPAVIVGLKEILNDKVKSKADITNNTNAPVLGEIGHAVDSATLVVTKNNRKFLAEQFRIIRSNLQYILPKVDKPVIHVTSSFSGEGKSFISTNLGAVLALSGKRTVILEFDIRKPKIMAGLGLKERTGITNYIVGNAELHEIIYKVPDIEDLFVIPCGPIPPNPSEMLLSDKIYELFASLRNQFDTIIIDTAPVGLVSDGIILGKHADASIYIVRYNYTLKKQIQLIDDIFRNKKLPHLSIIINDIAARGGYGGYYGYGAGYGYGYDSDYYDEAAPSSTGQKMMKKIRGRRKK